ncbi:MAG: penicillin-binding transpeptidase domain-containing protein [Patescibacteria group bacterium]
MPIFKKQYSINIEDDLASPEETLLDSGSEFSNIERPIHSGVFNSMFWGVTALLAIIFIFTLKIAIGDYKYYANLAYQNRSANFSIPPARGVIMDREGNPLVKNIPKFDVVGVSKEVKAALRDGTLDTAKLATTLKIEKSELESSLNQKTQEVSIFFIATGLSKEQILAIQGMKPPGVYLIPDVERVYVDGVKFSTVLGYVGKVNKDDLAKDQYYSPTDTIGRLGIEANYESTLRGEHGRIFFGDIEDKIDVDAQNGGNLVLNIDADLQRHLYDELRSVLAGAGLSRGAGIIQNPQTGAVLAMVSFPSFDNNQFAGGLSQSAYTAIFQNPARPLFNRVVSGLYNPGSTIKPLMGLMTLQEGIMGPSDTIQDCVSISIPNPFNTEVVYTFKNWRAELGSFNLRKSIANSCNIYFFTVGGGFGKIAGLGIQRIVKYLEGSFANKILGIDLPSEEHGFVPTPDWKESTRGEPWYQGDTYNTSIGQGDLSVTPLWLNSYISAISNGGTIYQPQIAERIVDSNKNTIKLISPKVLGTLPFRDDVLSEVKSDMEETVISGTAQIFNDLPVRVGAKTGTAEVVKGQSINSLFTAFAPFEHPELAVTVLIEGSASNQGLALRATHAIFEWYFNQTVPILSPTPSE